MWTYSSHLKDHLKEIVPEYLSSTTLVGLQSSSVLCLDVAFGAVAVTRSDSDSGSAAHIRVRCTPVTLARHTIDLDLVIWTGYSLLAIMNDRIRRIVDEVDDIWIILVRGNK
jgi:hypothetical protein